MSFMDEYNALKKKRQKGSSSDNETSVMSSSKNSVGSNSFLDEYNALKSQRQTREAEEGFSVRMTVGDIAPVRDDDEDSIFDGWFKKSESGVAKSILGTGADLLSDLGTGIVGMGEKLVDSLANIAPYSLLSQGNEMGYVDHKLAQKQQEIYQKAVKESDEFVKKDLYDEEKVSKQILSSMTSGAYLNNIAQSGGQVKTEDIILSREMKQTAQKYLDDEMEKDSVLDTKTDSLVQSAGQLLATSTLQAAGVPWYLTTGVTTYGGEVENALNQGATHEEAMMSGLVSAGAEILTEKISGGIKFGGKTLDDVATKYLARNISNKVGRTLLKLGMDMFGEGAEEVLSGVMSAVGQKLTYAKDKELEELFTKEDAWESFIGGAALGGGGSAVQAVNAAANGVDAVTELTKNEQKVVDKVYQDELKKRKGKVTEKEKAKIYDDVINSLEKGYISTETIEEVLGGDTYNRYTQAAEWESSLQNQYDKLSKEYDKLYNMKNGQKSSKQVDREAFLRDKLPQLENQLKNVKETSTLGSMKEQLSNEVFSLVKGDKLVESYNERARVGQKFEADLTQYDKKYHAAIQRAIDSGVLNNTNRSHELVDLAAKLEADKGMTIDFANNQKIKESGFAVEGKIVNGYKTKTGIGINVQSPKYLNTTVGHEITHVLEGTDAYKVLSETIKNYAIAKEGLKGYNARLKEIESLYKGMKDTTPEEELVSDLVGDYLFTDSDFVNKLSTEDRNLFQKIWDEIKYMCKIVTAGSKEARELERVKKAFEDAYRADTKASEGTQYSISELDNAYQHNLDNDDMLGAELAVKQAADNAGYNIEAYHGTDADFYTFSLGNRGKNGERLGVGYYFAANKSDADVYAHSSGKTKHVYLDIKKPVSHEIMTISENEWGKFLDFAQEHRDEYINGDWKGNSINKDFEIRDMLYYDNDADLIKGFINATAGRNASVAEGYMKMLKDSIGYDGLFYEDGGTKVYVAFTPEQIKSADTVVYDDSGNIIPLTERFDSSQKDIRYSLSDSDGKELSKEQQEYFKDSKVRDENGNLKVMYHGTPNGDYTVFKDGTYFTDNKEYADTYQNPGASSISTGKTATNPKTFEVYLDIKKPFDIADAEARDIYINDYIKGGNAMGINPYLSDAEYAKIDTIDWTEGEDLREFLIDNGYDYDGLVLDEGATGGYGDEVKSRGKSYVVFSPEQVKNIDNQKPTSNPDIRYSLSSETDKTYADAVNNRDWDTAQKLFDEAAKQAGYTKVVYHGTDARFTVFDTDEESTAREGHAWMADYPDGTIFLAEDYDVADGYGERVMNLLLDTSDIKVFEEPDMYAHRAMDDKYGYEVYNYPVIAVKGKDMTIYATLDNTAVKSADTATYDDNGNLIPLSERFNKRNEDIRFSLSEAVEETKDLIAVHNLHTAELLETLKLSGLPSPSVAIIKAKDGHEKYGDVSLILPKDAIDPQANKANRIYGSDAWTPTRGNAPVEYEVNYDTQRQFERTVEQLAKNVANGIFSRGSVLGMAGIEGSTDMNLKSIAEKISSYDSVQAAYVAENGGDVDVVYRTKVFDSYGNDALESYIGKVGEQEVARLAVKMLTGERLTADEIETAKDSMMENWVAKKEYVLKKKPELREARIAKFRENLSDIRVEDFVQHAWEFYEDSGATSDEIDYGATGDNLRAAANRAEVEAWVTEKLQGLLSEPAIYNGKDPFTPGGKRRSFKEMHWEYTAENIVRAMNNADARGANVWNVSGEAIIATATPEYKTIDEVRADKGRLFNAEKGDYEQIKDEISNELQQVTTDIIRTTEHQSDNQYDEEQTIGRVIMEAAQGAKTLPGIKQVFKKNGYRIGDAQAKAVLALFDHASKVPTGYFEAKPQRVVGFDEVGVYVIPYDADAKLKQELLSNGYAIAEYDPNVEGDRTRVLNQFEQYKFSLSNAGQQPKQYGTWNISGKDVAYVDPNSTVEQKTQLTEENSTEADMFPDDLAPIQYELERLTDEEAEMRSVMEGYASVGDIDAVNKLIPEHEAIRDRIRELEAEDNQRADSLTDADAPPEMEAPYTETENAPVENPFDDRNWSDVTGKKGRKAKAYMYEHPEVKPFFQAEAQNLLGEWSDTQRGEKFYNDQVYYESGGEKGWMGVKRMTSKSMETMLDEWGMSYDDIEKGLKAIIEDNGAENISAAKKVEFMLNDRLLNGYKNFYDRGYIEPNQDYINLLEEMQVNTYSKEAFDEFMANADQYAPVAQSEPLKKATPDTMTAPFYMSKDPGAVKGQTSLFEPPKPNPKVAKVLTEESAVASEKSGFGSAAVRNFVDKGMVFENLSYETGNDEIQAKWNSALSSNTEAKAQYFMENGADGVPALKDVLRKVNKVGKREDFFDYLYQYLNIDRMTLDERFGLENMTVFGDTITADVSRGEVRRYEAANPEFKEWAKEIYAIAKHLRQDLVEAKIISQETADWWEEKYPHYVPIGREDYKGLNISVPLDTNKTGVNAPIKRAKGGNSSLRPLDNVLAERIEQTYRAIARNRFGIELKNTLGTALDSQLNDMDVDEVIDTIEAQEEKLLKPGTMNSNPTFTVFENGERVEFEITEDMYDALKPVDKMWAYRNKALTAVSDVRSKSLTSWNPLFALYRNPFKDTQEVMINSQHAAATYANYPVAIKEILTNGKYASEYHQNGGKGGSYYDSKKKKFAPDDGILKKTIGLPLRAYSRLGEIIEEVPRLSEYIASRKQGRSVDLSMLDAARVTTNFAAGGDITKFFNAHGVNFLNASVQGASQHVRNFRQAKQEGFKGYVKLLAKYTLSGLPTILLNSAWDDDEDYEELSDYVKQNYYVVAKTEDGKFVRLPKGRTSAVIGELMVQMQNLATGDDEVDFNTFWELFKNNMAPNNPGDNNIIAPLIDVAQNETWYGEDLVPSRLQDLPAAEQFDESTDSISKWLGEATNTSPYKWNYLLDQYSGGLGDTFLPMLTPEAESGDNSFVGNMIAPWKKEVTTDMVLNNKNPGDFYDLRDELEVKSNSRNATEEDKMRTMYMDSVSWEMSDLYQQKREIQSGNLNDVMKYRKVREVQEQINELAKNALSVYDHVEINGLYSEVGDKRYNKDAESGKWYEIREKNSDGSDNFYYQKEQEVTQALGISYGDYWNNREEYNFAYDKPEQYALAQSVGGYESYRSYTSELYDIKADKDKNGKSISGSRKEKVIDWLNEQDIDYYHKIILFKNEYNADDTYNMEIIEYLNSRQDISYKEMESILKYLGFEVDSEGNISW